MAHDAFGGCGYYSKVCSGDDPLSCASDVFKVWSFNTTSRLAQGLGKDDEVTMFECLILSCYQHVHGTAKKDGAGG
jgi:hypothetical protein